METLKAAKFRFGDFELDCARRSLIKNGEPVALTSKTFDLLRQLVENHGSVVSKDELLEEVWPGQFVEENNLTVQISALRKVFGDKAGAYRFITTVPGKGYSFIEPVKRIASDSQTTALKSIPSENAYRDGEIVGRADEIAEITDLLRSSDGDRLVVLTGAGGSGKTSLARVVAGKMIGDFPDGVRFIELAAIQNADLVAPTIAKTIGIDETSDLSPTESLIDFLREKRTLLILDNFEQLTASAPLIKELISESPLLRILVTSRVALRLSNEREIVVPPLSVPPNDPALTPEQFNDYAAVRLFVARARTSNKSFQLSAANVASIAEICRRLDGLPLAIELAAARVKLLSIDSILSRLENSLQFLTGGAHDMPERQRTMRATLEWSYELLDENEKTIFRRLAVFAGGFSVEASEAVAGPDNRRNDGAAVIGEDRSDGPSSNLLVVPSVLDLLTSLLDNNLVVSKTQPDGNIRLHMLEVVREFAMECWESGGEVDSINRRHSAYFLALAEEAEPYLFSGQSIEWMQKLEIENENLRAAIRWQLDNQPESAARVAAALGQFWINRSHLAEARRWLEAALEKNSSGPAATRFKLLNTFSLVARHQGDYEATRRASEESLAASRAAKDLPQMILACHAVAALETREGNFDHARELILEALTISRELDDEKQIAFTLSFLSNLFLAEGNTAAARKPIEESLEISKKLGFKVNVSINLTNLGTVACYEGDLSAARRHFAESFSICWEMGNNILVSCCLDGVAAIAARSGEARQAACLAGAADGLRESIGYEIELTERLFRDEYLVRVRSALSTEEFEAVYLRGKTLDLDAAAELAFGPHLLENGSSSGSGREIVDLDPGESNTDIIIENRTFERIVIDEVIDKLSEL